MARRGLPPNLYCRKGYYSWRNPTTREEFGVGRDKLTAIMEANSANAKILTTVHVSLVDRITGDGERSVLAWTAKYSAMLAKRKLADNTRRQYKSLGLRMLALLGAERPVKSITALEVSAGLERVAVDEGKPRLAQALRSFMRDSFRESIVQGWRDDNPVRDTKLSVTVTVKRSRLSLPVFLEVYERAHPWLQNAMALALVSGQRREDVANAQFAAFHDSAWWCVQESEKSRHPHKIVIPFDLKPAGFHLSLGDVVAQCRRTGAVSRYLVHQTQPVGNSPVGSRIWVDTISRNFSSALATVCSSWDGKAPPTFHEIRSLSERIYSAMGIDTQALLGHNEAATTAIYHNVRGSEWTTVRASRSEKIVSDQ